VLTYLFIPTTYLPTYSTTHLMQRPVYIHRYIAIQYLKKRRETQISFELMMMMMMMMMILFPIQMESAMCNSGDAKPGPPNLSPVVDSFEQTTVQTSEYGKRVLITSREHQVEMNVLHMYGDDPYEWGKAHGELMKKEIQEFIPKVKEYVASEIKNDSKLEWAIELGVDVALDLSYEVTKKYTPSYVMQEI